MFPHKAGMHQPPVAAVLDSGTPSHLTSFKVAPGGVAHLLALSKVEGGNRDLNDTTAWTSCHKTSEHSDDFAGLQLQLVVDLLLGDKQKQSQCDERHGCGCLHR